jgi:hypothetical protein
MGKMTVFIAEKTLARIFHEMTGKRPSKSKHHRNDLHMGKMDKYRLELMTSSNSLMVRSS